MLKHCVKFLGTKRIFNYITICRFFNLLTTGRVLGGHESLEATTSRNRTWDQPAENIRVQPLAQFIPYSPVSVRFLKTHHGKHEY